MPSERDRAYMRRIGEIKAASHREARERHLALTPEERLNRSWELYELHRDSVDLSNRVDEPERFYERARALGLYQS